MKISFVHDYLNQYGGAERTLQLLSSMFPRAPIYTAIYDTIATGGVFEGKTVRTSFLQKIPLTHRYHHFFSLFMPLAVEQFDVSNSDVVFSISSSFAKGIITKPHVKHICYCLTPPRFLWDDSQKYVDDFKLPWFLRGLVPPFLSYLRIWDRQAAQRPDELIAISHFVKNRIQKYYGRDADVIYPPVNVSKFILANNVGDYFLMVGRLVAYKKFDLAIKVFNELGWSLKIVGQGVELEYLKSLAGSNIEFLGQVEDDRLADLYAQARALVFPQEEDFGIVPLEAMASGRPVIAYRGGGAIETIIDGVTGLFFDEQSGTSLKEALLKFNDLQFDSSACRTQAEKFDIGIFKQQILAKLDSSRSKPAPVLGGQRNNFVRD